MYFAYEGHRTYADLLPDGTIVCEDKTFSQLGAFAVWVFRTRYDPDKTRDDGWRTVHHDGKPIDHYRKVFLQLPPEKQVAAATAAAAAVVAKPEQ